MKSLYTKILILLLGSVLVTVLLVGGAGILNASRVVEEDSNQIMNLLCENKMQEINTWLLDIEQSVDTIYSFAESRFTDDKQLWTNEEYMDKYAEQIEAVMVNAVMNTEYALSVYLRFSPELLTPVSGVFLVKNDDGEFVKEAITDLSLYDPQDREHVGWYYEPLENGGPTWLEPYENQNINEDMISYVIPIYRDGVTIGVIGMDIDLKLLKERVNTISVYDTGYAILLSAAGDVVCSGENIEKDELEEELLGTKMKMISSTMTNGMELALVVPASEIYKTRNKLIVQCVIILLAVLAVATLAGIRLTRQLIRPLLELTQAAEQIEKGKWDVAIQCESKDEVGVLAQTLRQAIGELNQYIAYISRLAYTDNLTGMSNRHCMSRYYAEHTEEAMGNTGVVFCDLNGLKYINDHFGHAEGDEFICSFARLLQESFSGNECIRMSGDEFVVIVSGRTEEEFMNMVEKLRSRIKRKGMPMASVGWCWKVKSEGIEEIIKEAEEAMYADKKLFHQNYPMYRR